MKTIKYPLRSDWAELIKRPIFDNASLETTVKSILLDVKQNGDVALEKYTKQFDKVGIESLLVSEEEFTDAEKNFSIFDFAN